MSAAKNRRQRPPVSRFQDSLDRVTASDWPPILVHRCQQPEQQLIAL
jgi:hypothetical protein